MEKKKKYRVLKIGCLIFKILAWLALGLGVISSIVIFIGGGTPGAPRVTGLIGLLLGVIYFFFFYVASGVLDILLDISENTTKSSSI